MGGSHLAHEQAQGGGGGMYNQKLRNAKKKEKDVFTWWHCVYPSKADSRARRRVSSHYLEMADDWALGRAWVACQSHSRVPLVMEGNNPIWCHIFLRALHFRHSSAKQKQKNSEAGLTCCWLRWPPAATLHNNTRYYFSQNLRWYRKRERSSYFSILENMENLQMRRIFFYMIFHIFFIVLFPQPK